MIPHKTKSPKLPGTRFEEIIKEAKETFDEIERRTRRNPYVRLAYFEKRKVFFNLFWHHLYQKSFKERVKRLKYFRSALDLIQNSRNAPTSKELKRGEIWHRFGGLTKEGDLFYVQIKEDKKTKRLDFMSCFPGK